MENVEYFAAARRVEAPACSVCIANYNGVDLLAPCIDSVLAQSGDIAVEIIVHDDASTDESVAFLRNKYPQVELLVSATNVGFCISNNRMAELSRGKYLLLLNNDAVMHDGTLQRLLDCAEGQGFQGILSVPQYELGSGRLLDRGCLLDPFLSPVPVTASGARHVAIVMGACLWIPKELWQRLGGFPTWLESMAEDVFLCLAAWQAGPGVAMMTDGGYDHAVGRSFGGGKVTQGRLRTTYRRRFLSERNRLCVMIVFCPPWLLPIMLALQVLFMLMEGVLMSLVKRDFRMMKDIYVAAIASAWGMRRTGLNERARFKRLFGALSSRLWLRLITPIPQKWRVVARHGIPDVR